METIIFHIDVNSAYLSWSALERMSIGDSLDLRTVPAIIGGDIEKRHGVVLAKSIPAKKFHVRTGEPIVNAMKKCPFLILEPPDHALYSRRSRELIYFLSEICPYIEQVSIDECYMDYSAISSAFSSPEEAAAQIKERVFEKFNYTVNIGISNRKVLAKMASDFKKPNLVHTLYSYEIQEKLWPLPLSSLYMCGNSSQLSLKNLGMVTIGDLARSSQEIIAAHLKSHGLTLWEYANGIDSTPVHSDKQTAKGIGNSATLSKDAATREAACHELLILSESVAARLREAGQLAYMISTEIKYHTFLHVSHQLTLSAPICSTDGIYQSACLLFDELWDGSPIRLLGIRTSKLVSAAEPIQINLFDLNTSAPSAKQQRLDSALDAIRKKFGDDAVVRGSLLGTKKHDWE